MSNGDNHRSACTINVPKGAAMAIPTGMSDAYLTSAKEAAAKIEPQGTTSLESGRLTFQRELLQKAVAELAEGTPIRTEIVKYLAATKGSQE